MLTAFGTLISRSSGMTPEEFKVSGTWASCHHSIATYVTLAAAPTEFANPSTHAPTLYNPTALDWNEWMRYAKQLGCVGVTSCTKHVDGFCNWPTQVKQGGQRRSLFETTWYAANGNRNVLKEFGDTARKYGLRVGHYMCVWDEYIELLLGGSPAAVGSTVYTQWTLDQLSEVLDPTVYGYIDFIFLDGWGTTWSGSGVTFTDVVYQTVYDHVKRLQPGCVIAVNDHEDGSEAVLHGDVALWERNVDAEPLAANTTANKFRGGQALWDPLWPPDTGNIWFDHSDGVVMNAGHCQAPTSRRFRSKKNNTVYFMNFSTYLDGLVAADVETTLFAFGNRPNTLAGGDDFTLNTAESAGITLQAHTSVQNGSAWTKTFGTPNAVIDPNGVARVSDATGVVYTNNTTLSSADYRHEVDFKFLTVPNPNLICALARVFDSTHDYRWQASWNGTVWLFQLQVNNAGLTQITSFDGVGIPNTPNGTFPNTVPTVGYLYRLVLQVTGSTNPVTLQIEVWIDETGTGNNFVCWSKGVFTTATVIASGPPGIYWSGLGSATTGLQIERSRSYIVDVTALSAPTGLAFRDGSGGPSIAWSGSGADLWLFEIFRSVDDITYVRVGETTKNEYVDDRATIGVTYYYKVRSMDTSWNASALSSAVSGAWTGPKNIIQPGGHGPINRGMLMRSPL
jgi:hypothetical protein